MPFEVVVELSFAVVEGFEGAVEVVQRQRVAPVLEQYQACEGVAAVDEGGGAELFDESVQLAEAILYLEVGVDFLVHVF